MLRIFPRSLFVFSALMGLRLCAHADAPPVVAPLTAPAKAVDFSDAAALVETAVNNGRTPGAVLLIGHDGQVVVRKAYGHAAIRPVNRPIDEGTIFDLASLTKVVGTSPAIMLLVQRGQVDLDAPVMKYLPVFAKYPEKQSITIRDLMTHTAGYPSGGPYAGRTLTVSQVIDDIAARKQLSTPGTKFLYSDLSFITLGAVVEAVTGQTLDKFCQEQIFTPLGMKDTAFRRNESTLPPERLDRIAATTSGDDTPTNRGLVHDPSARALDGVAGSAGVFSTVDDLGRYCRMFLNGGELDGVRLFKPETIQTWTTNQSPAIPGERALGWDMGSPYSVRGTLSPTSFGHTGFTGTSIWIDPPTKTYIVLLTNAVHGQPAQSMVSLRRAVSTAVSVDLGLPQPPKPVLPATP